MGSQFICTMRISQPSPLLATSRANAYNESIMANGLEDLHEKEKDVSEIGVAQKQYDQWHTFQGREDAEMLQEKSAGWSSVSANRGDYDDREDD
jgi:hypothetical protein